MNYDDFKRMIEEQRRKNFASYQEEFNKAMRAHGDARTLDDVLGGAPKKPLADGEREPAPEMPRWEGEKLEQLVELFLDVWPETLDEDPRDVVLRAMATYRSFVRHARSGGQVKFVKEGEKDRTLKVRLR